MSSQECYFLAALALGDLVGLAAFLAVFLAGAAFFVAISLAPLGKDVGHQCWSHIESLWYPGKRNNSNTRHSLRERLFFLETYRRPYVWDPRADRRLRQAESVEAQ